VSRQGIADGRQALAVVGRVIGAGDVGEVPVAVPDQVLRKFGHAAVVVRQDCRDVFAGVLLDERYGDAAVDDGADLVGVDVHRRNDHGVHRAAPEHPAVVALRRLARLADDHQAEACCRDHIFDAAHDLVEERIVDLGQHQADRVRLLAGERLGVALGVVVQLAHRLQHPLPCLLAHAVAVIEDARNRPDRNPGLPGDIEDGC